MIDLVTCEEVAMMKICASLVLIFLCHGQLQARVCSNKLIVDEVNGISCSHVRPLPENVSCNSLSDALQLISQEPHFIFSQEEMGCVEIEISQGNYAVEGTVILGRSVLLSGREGDEVSVDLHLPATDPPEFQYSLSFRDAGFAGIDNINFHGSSGIIGFDNVSEVVITDSSFRNFLQGAVDIYNSYDVVVSNSTFENNGPVVITKNFTLRGHSGGLSIAFFFTTALSRGILSADIRGSTFCNNSVFAAANGRHTTSQLLRRLIPTERGGGSAISVFSATPVHVRIDGCVFERNVALTYGGGLFIAWGTVSNHRAILNNTIFLENESLGGAGGLEIGFGSSGADAISNQVYASNLQFVRNKAIYGGGVYVFVTSSTTFEGGLGNFVSFENCLFEGNSAVEYGGAVGLILSSATIIFHDRTSIIPFLFDNCSFVGNNGGRGGTLSTSYLPLMFIGINQFSGNRGASLTILGTLVQLQGQLIFLSNDASLSDGGALNTISLGQLELSRGSRLVFHNNSGNLGAGIVVSSVYVPRLFSNLLYNPLCVLLLENFTQPFSSLEPSQISIKFSGNKAVVGSSVYTSQIGLCSWTGATHGTDKFFNHSLAFRWNFVNISNDSRNSGHSPDDTNPKYYIQTMEADLIADTNFTAYPGESVPFGVKVVDELNLSTVSILRFNDNQKNGEIQKVGFKYFPSVVSLTHVTQSNINLSLLTRADQRSEYGEAVVESILQNTVKREEFQVKISPCPLGYAISRDTARQSFNTCHCNFENEDIVNCNGFRIQIKDGHWASSPHLKVYPCPYQYCRCHIKYGGSRKQRCLNVVDGTNPNSQCTCKRHGVLCGSCDGDSGFSAILNQCVSCSNVSALLIVLLVVADVIVFVVLLFLSLQFPAFLLPCLFYFQVLPYISEHFSPTFQKVYSPLYYITSASSFYFVYDFCLLKNLSPVLSYLFRFIPFFVALVVCLATIILARFCHQHVCFRRLEKWHGVCWIINLLYSHLVYTSMTILKCFNVPIAENTRSVRWYVSGTVECFKGYHLPLALLAIATLLTCAFMIPFTALTALNKVPFFSIHLSQPLTRPFKTNYRWWYAMELARRFFLILFVVAFPANDYPTAMVVSILLVVAGLTWPYADRTSNILDILLSVDVLILLLIKNTRQIEEAYNEVSFKEVPQASGCVDHDLHLSTHSAILVPFYYLPLVVMLIALSIWITAGVRSRLKLSLSSKQNQDFKRVDTIRYYSEATTLSELHFPDKDLGFELKDYVQSTSL